LAQLSKYKAGRIFHESEIQSPAELEWCSHWTQIAWSRHIAQTSLPKPQSHPSISLCLHLLLWLSCSTKHGSTIPYPPHGPGTTCSYIALNRQIPHHSSVFRHRACQA